jgi:hypothetical protein
MPKMTFGGEVDQNRSAVVLGTDAHSYVSETKEQYNSGPPDMGGRKDIAKASDPRVSQIRFSTGPPALMESVNTTFMSEQSSALAPSFVKQGPAPGFDRLTANEPQFEIGAGPIEPYLTKTHDEHSDPKGKPTGPEPHFHSLDRRLFDATTSLRKNRHDLGYEFNIVTGSPRRDEQLPVGPRLCTSQDKDQYGDLLGAGDGGGVEYNLTQGRCNRKAAKPPRPDVNAGRVPCGAGWA